MPRPRVAQAASTTDTIVIVVVLIGSLILLKLFSKGFKRVRHAEVMIVERFGSYLVCDL